MDGVEMQCVLDSAGSEEEVLKGVECQMLGVSRKVAQEWKGEAQRLGGRDIQGMSRGTPKTCPGGQTGLAGTEGVCGGGVRCEVGEASEPRVWFP